MPLPNKLDSSLGSRYRTYLRDGVDAKLLVSLSYTGDLAAIEAAGFRTTFRGPEGYATGEILLSRLEEIAGQPGVVRLSIGRRPRVQLDQSVPKIEARPDVWEWDAAQSKFVPANGVRGTGKGVLIGIIDTGIDWRHPFFLKESEPLKITRIRSIWDIGLRPDSDEVAAGPPDPSLLYGEAGPGVTYGIEYNWARIEAALNNGPSIRHRDTEGHGTHVASIAAGNGGPDRNYIGVAPEADLIVVKTMFLDHDPPRADNDPAGTEIHSDTYFKDAVTYILNKARAMDMSVVINVSLGVALGPHDGYTDIEDWMTHTFRTTPRACLVAGSGNEAQSNQHAIIEFTEPGAITLELELKDGRTVREAVAETLALEIYYPAGVASLDVALNPRDGGGFRGGPLRGEDGVDMLFDENKFTVTITHVLEEQGRPFTQAGALQRSKIRLEMQGLKDPGGTYRYDAGRYALRLEASEPLTAHLWSEVDPIAREYFRVVGPPVPAGVTISDEYLISNYAGSANVVCVAAYNQSRNDELVLGRSSRGPLVNYENMNAPHPVGKPDVGAPGYEIDAAASHHAHSRTRRRMRPPLITQKSGTSMASPHVAGVVALMFEKRPNLTAARIVEILRTNGISAAEPEEINEVGPGRVRAKRAFDAS